MTRIVVPLDGSRFAETAVPWAGALAGRTNGSITLVSVIPMSSEFAAWITSEQLSHQPELADVIGEREQYLAAVADQFGLREPEIAIRFGSPAREILAVAESVDAQPAVIVMSTHGYGGIKRLAIGSVALQVIHKYQGPIMTVRDDAPSAAPRLDKVLIPVDGSDYSAAAVEQTQGILGEPPPQLHLVRAVGTPSWATRSINHGLVADFIAASQEWAQEKLDTLLEQAASAGYEATAELRPEGNVVEEIVSAATAAGADIIAMTTHGLGGVGRIVIGSTADGVLRHSPIPVLLFRSESDT